jgi:hypothetical protein
MMQKPTEAIVMNVWFSRSIEKEPFVNFYTETTIKNNGYEYYVERTLIDIRSIINLAFHIVLK